MFVSEPFPWLALIGEGCPDSNTRCLLRSILLPFLCAKAPQSKKTTPSFSSEIFCITASVKKFHFKCLWLLGVSFLTVSVAFNSKTPCCAQCSKLPEVGIKIESRSSLISLKIFLNEGGILTASFTEKQSPLASPSP